MRSLTANHHAMPALNRRASVRIILAAFSLLFVVKPGRASAQAPGESAPAEVADRCVARVTDFLRAVAAMSPMPPGADPDRAQAWPRRDYRELRVLGSATPERMERLPVTRVQGHESSGTPRAGTGWEVSLLNGEITAKVDTETGQIRSFHDKVLSNALLIDPPPPLSAYISQETAIARAVAYLRQAGMPMDDLVLRSVELDNSWHPARAATIQWIVRWDRVWNSVLFEDQSVGVWLDAQAGRLLMFGSGIALHPPAEARLDVSPARSVELATAFLASRGMRPAGDPDLELKIVTPTDFWSSPDYWVRNIDPNTRLSWIVRFPGMLKAPDNTLRRLVVWVDTITGQPLGGDVLTTMSINGRPVVPGMAIGALLRKAVRIEARTVGGPKSGAKELKGKGRGARAVNARILDSAKDPLRFYGAVAGVVGKPGKKPSGFAPTHRLFVYSEAAQARPVTLEMDARSGLLANENGETVKASPGLWAWLRPKSTLAPPTPHVPLPPR